VRLDVRVRDEAQQVAHALVLYRGIAKRQVRVDLVRIVTTDLTPSDVPGLLEVGEDPVRRAFRDLSRGGKLGNGAGRIPRDRKQ
jgi:hypothetical protein